MSKEILINVGPGETRIAIVRDARLSDLILERRDEFQAGRAGHSVISNIYLGRVQRVLPGMQAAFVEIGLERCGFLGAREAQCLAELAGYSDDGLPPIAKCVHEGEVILVQAVKDPIGEKGARLSANVTLPGRFLVFVPNQSGVALSRRIEAEEDRERLTALIEDMIDQDHAAGLHHQDKTAPANANGYGVDGKGGGFIVRTVAIDATAEEIYEDARQLKQQWKDLQLKLRDAKVPSAIHYDLDPVTQTLRDEVDVDTTRVLIDDEESYQEARRYAQEHMPNLTERVHVHRDSSPIFDLYDIEHEIEAALSPRAGLPHGGWITIETTEALTSVDVNSGSYTAGSGLEETSVRTNVDAARELMRQVKLRGIGGLIIIDFIHMEQPENIQRVLDELAKGAEGDRTPTQISEMSEFGIVQMTRKRVREPLARLMTEPCHTCHGEGRLMTVATVGNEIFRRVEAEAKANPGRHITVTATPRVVDWIEAQDGGILDLVKQKVAGEIILVAEPKFIRGRYLVSAG